MELYYYKCGENYNFLVHAEHASDAKTLMLAYLESRPTLPQWSEWYLYRVLGKASDNIFIL